MTDAQADQIIDFLYGMLRPPDHVGTRKHWRMQLAPLDPDISSKAVIQGMQTWRFFPPWSEFKEIYRAIERSGAPSTPVPEPRRGVAAPEWVHVWAWCRGWCERPREQKEERPFPQQDGYDALSTKEYETLREEWIGVGSPKVRLPNLPSLRT